MKNIIFDLGNVLIRLNFNHWLKVMQKYNNNITMDKLNSFIDIHTLPFNESSISEREIMERYIEFLNCPHLSSNELKEIHCSLFVDGPTKSTTLLNELSNKYNLYVLSNTDPWHVERLSILIPGFNQLFKKKIFSYDAKAIKPDIKIYDYLITQTNINIKESIFFDDTKENVDKGNAIGLQSVIVNNEDELFTYIKQNLL